MLRLFLYVFSVYLFLIPSNGVAQVRCDVAVSNLPSSVVTETTPAIIKKLREIEVDSSFLRKDAFIKVSQIVEYPDSSFGIQIQRDGEVVGFYGALAIPKFVEDFPAISRRLGFKVLEYKQSSANPPLYKAQYEIPDIVTLNKNIKSLRQAGVLPDNGSELIYVTGEIKNSDYIKLIGMGKIPVGLDKSFFHDVNVHMLGFLLLPKDVFELYQKEITLIETIMDDPSTLNFVKNSTDFIQFEQTLSYISRLLDSMTAISDGERKFFPDLSKTQVETENLAEIKKILERSPYAQNIDDLIRGFQRAYEKYGDHKAYNKWLESETLRLKSAR